MPEYGTTLRRFLLEKAKGSGLYRIAGTPDGSFVLFDSAPERVLFETRDFSECERVQLSFLYANLIENNEL